MTLVHSRSKPHLSARWRKTPSLPTKYLIQNDLLRGRILDYGCGYGTDADVVGAEKFDPYYFPVMPVGTFDTILCHYVLNVIPTVAGRENVLTIIRERLAPRGIAYVTVRNDYANLNGWTNRGTWQGLVELDLPKLKTNSNFTMYLLSEV